jgi:uncharacterized protein (TIGR02996 family)
MTTEELALLAAVLARPDDDLPRLVYADYLEELGTEHHVARAEFIRLQCSLADGNERSHPQRAAWQIRERVLYQQFSQRWLAPLKERGQPLFTPRSHGQFRRGFVEVLWMPAGWFVDKARKIATSCPARELRLTHVTAEDLRRLAQCEELCAIRTLDVSDRRLGNEATMMICQSSFLEQLRVLRLRACDLDDDIIDDLLRPKAGWTLTELDVSLNRFSSAGEIRLRQSLIDCTLHSTA